MFQKVPECAREFKARDAASALEAVVAGFVGEGIRVSAGVLWKKFEVVWSGTVSVRCKGTSTCRLFRDQHCYVNR